MKVTRRELVGLAMATVAVAQDAPEAQNQRNADELDKVELKQDTEPAFAFRA
jgi:hypothetical protein